MSHWRVTVGETNYTAKLAGVRIKFTKDQGAAASFGGNDVPLPRFLRSEKWQSHVREVFGPDVLSELLTIAQAVQDSSNSM